MAGGIKIIWKDRNYSEDQHNIYRSDTPMTLSNMPSPIATVGSNVTEYIDYDVVEGNTYYYRVGAVRGNDVAISDEFSLTAEVLSLPGPSNISSGDAINGYYGRVDSSDIITWSDLSELLNVSSGVILADTGWFKVSIDSKVLYVPRQQIRHSISWEQLNDLRLVDGSTTITINMVEYSVRLLKTVSPGESLSSVPPDQNDPTFTHNSEWNRIMYRLCETNPVSQNNGNWESFTSSELLSSTTTGSSNWCQESFGTSALIRGTATNISDSRARGYSNVDNYYGWRPVLEAII